MQCHKLGYLQQLGNYFRVRHYDGVNPITGKSKFSYHQQSKEYAISKLGGTGKAENLIVQDAMVEKCSSGLDQNLQELSPKSCGRSLVWLGHQPPTLTTRVQIPATALAVTCFDLN